jgi:methionyl-tRNA formyltransferase
MALRILFFGSPAFSVPSLARLAASSHPIVGVVTQPDRPRGRGQHTLPTPVKVLAVGRNIPVLHPERLKDPSLLAQMTALRPDLGVVAAYGRLLPQALLDVPRLGMINVHASLLPRWRGAAPVHRAILAGDAETGITIMRVVQALDAGPMLARRVVAIGPEETSRELEIRLAEVGADLVAEVVDRLDAGPVLEEPQDESLVTYAPRLERRESAIDWTLPARAIHNRIRGLQPWPQAGALWRGRRVLFKRSRLVAAAGSHGTPGTILSVEPDALHVAAGLGVVGIRELQTEGGRAMPVEAWRLGHAIQPGDRFDPLIFEP